MSEWPAAGIALTRVDVDVDAQLLIAAAARAREMFPNQATSHPGGTWSSFGVVHARPADDPPAE